jgi:polar amino acid transport system permease protein
MEPVSDEPVVQAGNARPEPPAPASVPGVRPEPIKAVPVRHPGRWVSMVIIAVLVVMFVHMLVTNQAFQWSFMVDHMFTPPVLQGVRTTLILTVLAMVVGIILGVVLAVMRLSGNPLLSGVAWVYIWFFRAVPRIVLALLFGNLGILYTRYDIGVPFDRQLMALFGLHDRLVLFGIPANAVLTGFMAGLMALALSEAAYMAEIVRAGIRSVGPGQTEAAVALGMSPGRAMVRIVLPQAMRVIVPPTGNETIAMLKDTAVVAYVPVTNELFFQLQAVGSHTFQVFPMYVASCLWYVGLTSVLMVGQYYLERYFSKGYGPGERARIRLRSLQAETGGRIG